MKITLNELRSLVKNVIREELSAEETQEGRNNPLWINLVSKLKSLPYSPKILTFDSYDTPPIPSQSLNWGTAKSSNGKYAFGLSSTDSKMPKERMFLFNSEDRNNEKEMHNWWKKRGYATDGKDVSINFKDADKLRMDIEAFFKVYPPQ
jgi:hypothetical protein